ncbi:maleylpyruvate isomerase family mycothiol-dependent enzyme [Streptomyces albus subsp. chlorinus]|uniref:maleylpyruvate isomerase family mycothiol-dependent enzyme n=1 Tax=Streptomyces albus TaxID=1888 RepID=UPI00157049F1|nr:maleylpyruvate isomerase family mycothiol-dependent enzyme [Streptomyces albus]NSC21110.1 maleylpyruvate isomerase family mycothiol-dependent enzyme [Streptomyces albus subsp. chlorinus]
MQTSEFIDVLDREGRLFADAVARADPSAPVPACPDWAVRDLASHLGTVHRWATGFVREGRTEPVRPSEPSALPDAELAPWLREGHGLLVETLRSAPQDLSCWTILPAPSPLAFWSRRQAHETAVHRVDAESALGVPLSPLDAGFAADGIDELLRGFYPRRGVPAPFAASPRTLYVRATDVPGAAWTVHLGEPPRAEAAAEVPAAPDCVYEGRATDLYLVLWNRLPLSAITLTGDESVAHRWRELFNP